jgi:hypothetical protein
MCLQVRPVDKLNATIERNRTAGDDGQSTKHADQRIYNGSRASNSVLQNPKTELKREPAQSLDHRCDIHLPKFLLEQHQISL